MTSYVPAFTNVASDDGIHCVAVSGFQGNAGLWYSSDSGVTWTQSNIISGNASVYDLTGNRVAINGNYALAALETPNSNYISSDYGATWTAIASGTLPPVDLYTSCAIIMFPNNWFYGSGSKLYWSSDNGTTWTASTGATGITFKSWDMSSSGNAVACGETTKVYISYDYGHTFTQSTTTLPFNSRRIAMNNANKVILFSQTTSNPSAALNIYISSDAGNTFTLATTQPPGKVNFACVLVMSKSGDIAYTKDSNFGMYRTADAGNTWSNTNTGNSYNVCVTPDNTTVTIQNNANYFISTDSGVTFASATAGSDVPIPYDCSITFVGSNLISNDGQSSSTSYTLGQVYSTDLASTFNLCTTTSVVYTDILIQDSSLNELFHGYIKSGSNGTVPVSFKQVLGVYDFNKPTGPTSWEDVLLPTTDVANPNATNIFTANGSASTFGTAPGGINFTPSTELETYLSLPGPSVCGLNTFGYNALYYDPTTYDPTQPPTYSITFATIPEPICFAHGTKILCLTADLEEKYVPIEQLTSGSIVKTFKHGYRKIFLIGKGHMLNNVEKPHACMYTMKKTETNGLIEDLTLTGGHSILVDDMSDEDKAKVTELLGSLVTIDGKFLHVCSIHPDFEQVHDKEVKTYYHFVLENDDDKDQRFGVYANGILAETPSFNQFIKHEFIPL